ncbi:hypothetical protein [Pararhizobium sp. DWP3-4]|uniref:hypothetical protein n=1 Tax=Pararhizobium sp. DWP3-4 TaxID=2804565 RepID=UPI003CF59911
MLYLILAMSAIICTFFIGRFFAAKTRLVEKAIDDIVVRKLSNSRTNIELSRLREQNGVMRNLLIDMLENEGPVVSAVAKTPSEQDRAAKARVQRRREIFGEAVFALQQAGNAQQDVPYSKIDRLV